MSIIERYRVLYEYEKDCNAKMLSMLESVPEARRGNARFQKAVSLAGHVAACRENWLDSMAGDGVSQVAWIDESCPLSILRPRFTALEIGWTTYLGQLDDEQLAESFEFPCDDGNRYSLPTEAQIVQLFHHASYHRGQVALLVDQLGGETADTDYIYWAVPESA